MVQIPNHWSLETEKNSRGRHHEPINQNQVPKVQGLIPLELTEIALRRLLVVYIKLLPHNTTAVIGATNPELDLVKAVGGEAEDELVAAALVLEAVDAAEGLGDGPL